MARTPSSLVVTGVHYLDSGNQVQWCQLGPVPGELGRAGAWPRALGTSWADLVEGCTVRSPSSPVLKSAT